MLQSPSLGQLLVETGVLAQAALDEVLEAQRQTPRRLGELLVERGLVRPQQLAQLLSHQLSCPWVSLLHIEIPPGILALLPRAVAIAQRAVPIHVRVVRGAKILYVATDDPTDDDALAACESSARMPVKPMVALTTELSTTLTRLYGAPDANRSVAVPRINPSPPTPPSDPALDEIDELGIIAATVPPSQGVRATAGVAAMGDPSSTVRPGACQPTHILVLSAPEPFLRHCREAASALDAIVVEGRLEDAAELIAEQEPCAIVVTEEVLGHDTLGIARLALEIDAVLVSWAENAEGRQLEPLLAGAVKRWRRSSYSSGSIVDGRYELLRDLGGPLEASRWEVRDLRTGRRSVLKVGIRTAGDDIESEAVSRERRALERVEHPGALDLRDAGETDLGDPFVVIDRIEGRTLEGLITARGKLPIADACSLVLQIADVLTFAHASNVTHGDVRSETIVVVHDGYGFERAKLVDWHKAIISETGELDPHGDIEALGRCAFEALAGRKPAGDEPPDEAGIAPAVARAVMRAFTKERPARFESMKAFITALEAAGARSGEKSRLLEASRRKRRATTDDSSPKTSPRERKWPRAPYQTPVRVEVPGIGAVVGRSEDVSVGGLFVVTHVAIPADSVVTLRFALPVDGKVITESGVVKWSRSQKVEETDRCAIGIELSKPSAETVRQIESYVILMSDARLAPSK